MTSIGINCEQNGSTLRSAPTDLYSSRTSGIATFFSCHLLYLNTGILSAEAAAAIEMKEMVFMCIIRFLCIVTIIHLTKQGHCKWTYMIELCTIWDGFMSLKQYFSHITLPCLKLTVIVILWVSIITPSLLALAFFGHFWDIHFSIL